MISHSLFFGKVNDKGYFSMHMYATIHLTLTVLSMFLSQLLSSTIAATLELKLLMNLIMTMIFMKNTLMFQVLLRQSCLVDSGLCMLLCRNEGDLKYGIVISADLVKNTYS